MTLPERGGFDLDGVLALMDEALLAALQARGKLLSITAADRHTYDFCDCFPDEVSPAELKAVYEDGTFLAALEPCRVLMAAAHQLVALGVELHVVTARRRGTWGLTRDWASRTRLAHSKLVFVPAALKPEYVRQEKLGFFVEDRLDTALAISEHAQSFLVAHPYNVIPIGSSANRRLRRWSRERFASLPLWLAEAAEFADES